MQLNRADEQLLTAASGEVSSHIGEGMDPTDAVCKVAAARNLQPGWVDLLCQTTNTGRHLAQMRSRSGVLNKFAAFPLADPDTAKARLFVRPAPPVAKAAMVSHDGLWLSAKSMKAAAEAGVRIESTAVDRPSDSFRANTAARLDQETRIGEMQRAKIAKQASESRAGAARRELSAALVKVADYFGHLGRERLPLAAVEQVAASNYGAGVRHVFDCVARMGDLREPRWSGSPEIVKYAVRLDAEPFPGVKRCLDLASLAARTAKEAAAADAVFQAAHRATLPGVKSALFSTPAMGAAVGTAIQRSIVDMPSNGDKVQKAIDDLSDPSHMNEMRSIRASAALTGMLTDPDDPISGYEPEEVMTAFNRISSVAPRLADNPTALRTVLRRELLNNTQPFELKEMTGVEKDLKALQQPRAPMGGAA